LAREYEKKDLEPANKDFTNGNLPRQKRYEDLAFSEEILSDNLAALQHARFQANF